MYYCGFLIRPYVVWEKHATKNFEQTFDVLFWTSTLEWTGSRRNVLQCLPFCDNCIYVVRSILKTTDQQGNLAKAAFQKAHGHSCQSHRSENNCANIMRKRIMYTASGEIRHLPECIVELVTLMICSHVVNLHWIVNYKHLLSLWGAQLSTWLKHCWTGKHLPSRKHLPCLGLARESIKLWG